MDTPHTAYGFMDDPGIEVRFDAPLRDCTTFRLGGPCRCLATCSTEAQLARVLAEWGGGQERVFVLGGGSNVLVSDSGYDGVVVRYCSEVSVIHLEDCLVSAAGSARIDEVARHSAEAGLDGLVFASGIPGTVGGALAGNAGAFGQVISGVLESVGLVDQHGVVHERDASELSFAYRRSSLQDSGFVVARAVFRLARAAPDLLRAERERILALRRDKHPDWRSQPCAGSFFRNPEAGSDGKRRSAGWYLEQAGALAMRRGGAAVFERHANIVIKAAADCTAADVYLLARDMQDAVMAKFGIQLVPEVRLLGSFDGAESGFGCTPRSD